ncbi:MAG: EAL domain-containing protein [Nocardioides sp.]
MRPVIDDVGAGFSSLRHIVVTAPDIIKLDRTLIDGISTDPVLRTLARSLVDFAHGFDVAVVAEGVETPEDAATLLALDVDHGQGWHFGRPGPAEDLVPCPPREVLRTQWPVTSPRAAAPAG